MMKIILSPIRCDDTLIVEKLGDILTINGEPLDFSPVTEGATIKALNIPSEWICGDLTRSNGDLIIHMALPHGADPADYVAFPDPIENPPDGVIDLPFSPYSTRTDEVVNGGRNITITSYEWRTTPVVTTEFVADPQPEPTSEETAHVDA